MNKKITIKDIAKAVGCAPSMVSMAINDKKGISKELKEKILKAAKELNWSPNHGGAFLRKGTSNKILMVLPYDGLTGNITGNSGMLALLDGLIKGLEHSTYDLDIAIEIEDAQSLYPRLYQERKPAAFVFVNIAAHDWRIKWLTEQDIPFICFGQTQDPIKHNFVDFDNSLYSFEATKYLLEQNFKEIYLFASNPDYTYSRELIAGYKKAFDDYGLTFDESYILTSKTLSDMQNPEKLMEFLKQQGLKGKAFVSPTSPVTIALTHALLQENIDPYKDVAITSLVVGRTLELLAPFVKLWRQDTQVAGKKMADIITGYLSDPKKTIATHLYMPKMIERE